ncbi:MAG: Ig-like domain-containing protein [Candidatus Zixiibacteriota bacterium]
MRYFSLVVLISAIVFIIIGCGKAPVTESGGDIFAIVTINPVDGSDEVPIGSPIRVTFSNTIDSSSAVKSVFEFKLESNSRIVHVAGEVIVSDNELIFIPQDNFLIHEQYSVTLSSRLKSVAGQFLEIEYTWRFSTGDGTGYYWGEKDITSPLFVHVMEWGNGKFMAFGGDAIDYVFATSPDGFTWQPSYNMSSIVHCMTFWQSKYIIGCFEPTTILYSDDGLVWNAGQTDGFYPIMIRAMASNDDILVAIGYQAYVDSSGIYYLAMKSSDGVNWTEAAIDFPADTSTIGDICWTGSEFVIVMSSSGFDSNTYFITSSNGTDWSTSTVPSDEDCCYPVSAIASSGDMTVAVGSNRFYYSDDNIHWSYTDIDMSSETYLEMRDVIWDGSKFIAVGRKSVNYIYGGAVVYTSVDGKYWRESFLVPSNDTFSSIAWSGSRLILGTSAFDGKIFYSPY